MITVPKLEFNNENSKLYTYFFNYQFIQQLFGNKKSELKSSTKIQHGASVVVIYNFLPITKNLYNLPLLVII